MTNTAPRVDIKMAANIHPNKTAAGKCPRFKKTESKPLNNSNAIQQMDELKLEK
jgi:hypothetical protein